MIYFKKNAPIVVIKLCVSSLLTACIAINLSSCGLVGAALNAAGAATRVLSIKALFSCLPEGTAIDTPNGSMPVESLKTGDKVIGYSGDPVTIKQIHAYDEDEVKAKFMTVEFRNGTKVDLCEMHRIGGIRAKNLAPGNQISDSHVVTSITRYVGVKRSFDILTEDAGYQIGEIPVNSMIAEMAQATKIGKIKDCLKQSSLR